jgi:hypothetical protein
VSAERSTSAAAGRRRGASRVAAAAALLSLAASAVPQPPGMAEGEVEPPRTDPAPIKGADLELLEEVRQVATRVEQLRGQTFDRPPVAVRAPDPMREVAAEIRAGNVLARERLAARGAAWRDLGLAGDEGGPARLLVALAGDIEGIGFDPAGNRLLVAPDRLTAQDFQPREGQEGPATILAVTGVRQDEPLIAHVVTHVRQRERLGRDPLHVPTTDGVLAAAAWAEGEANLVAVRYLFAGLGVADDVLGSGLSPEDVLDGRLLAASRDALSAIERDLLHFVYIEGFAQSVTQFRAGGWSALDGAMNRRRSTRDILHADRSPLEPAAFPAPSPPIPGAVVADEDALGEQAIVTLIAHGTGKDNLGLIAGDGWAGDRVLRWTRPGQPGGATEWTSRWADAAAAEEFDYGLVRAFDTRFADQSFTGPADGERELRADDRLIRIRRTGSDVRVLVLPASWSAPPASSTKATPR